MSRVSITTSLLAWSLVAMGAPDAPRVLILGDSLSSAYGLDAETAWVSMLEERLAREGYPHRVVNASVAGETSGGGASRVGRLLAEHSPAIVVLELGANDGLQGLPTAQLEGNLRTIVEASRRAGARVLLVGMRLPPNYGPVYVERFESLYPRLSTELDLHFLPFLLEGVAARSEMVQPDGLHPNDAAQGHILENVWRRLRPLL